MINGDEINNYSKIDGSSNKEINSSYITLENTGKSYCGKCGNKIDEKTTYCKYCGTNVEVGVSKNLSSKDNYKSSFDFKNIISSFSITKCILTSVLSIAILFVFSLVIRSYLFSGDSQLTSVINPLHILLLSNFGTITMNANTIMSGAMSGMSLNLANSAINANIGLLIIIILPIIALAISYVVV